MQKIGLISKKFNEILRFENFETTLTIVKFHNSLHLCMNLCLSIHVASVPSFNLTCAFLPPMCVFLHHPCAFLCHPLLFRFSVPPRGEQRNLARAVGVAVGCRSGGRLAMTLVATKIIIIFFNI